MFTNFNKINHHIKSQTLSSFKIFRFHLILLHINNYHEILRCFYITSPQKNTKIGVILADAVLTQINYKLTRATINLMI